LNEGGILKRILVREGERVEQGASLIELEDSEAAAAYGVLRGALDAVLARKARLEVEAALGGKIVFPTELLEKQDDPSVAELIEREKKLFLAKREILNGQIVSLERQIREIDKEHEACQA
jgi:multidrug efflux pump subunit AcrA (membrane-fusion protein)